MAPSGVRYGEGAAAATNGGLTLRDPVTGAQYVQIQLLQVRSPDISEYNFSPNYSACVFLMTLPHD